MFVLKVVVVLVGLAALLPMAWFGKELARLFREEKAYTQLQDTADLQVRASEHARGYVKGREHVRLVVGIWQRGRQWVGGFGTDRPEAAETPDGRVLFEIGSITKVFTGILLARAEAEGRLRLETPIGDLLPPGTEAPEPVRAITLGQLSTHTSGLPRLPDNLESTFLDVANPYANYRADDLLAYLRGARLRRPPGTKSDYSNLGAGLLGSLLARKDGRSYGDLVGVTICGPLRMSDTAVSLTDAQRARLVQGRAPGGRPVPGWDFDAMAPAGALHSTVDDMLMFLEANLEGRDGPLGQALRRAQEVHFGLGKSDRQGLGWQIQDDVILGLTTHWHNGGTGGYRSFLGFVADRQVGVVLLSNNGDAMRGDDAIDRIGLAILRLATKVSLEPPRDAAPGG